jgi:multidrug efflux system membrane fusion protein
MTANVALMSTEPSNTSLLPLTSIYRKDGEPAVWVYDAQAQKVSLRPVVIGQYREDGVLVTSGVASGEWVVAAGVHKLREGDTVRPFEGAGERAPTASKSSAPAHATTASL